MLDIQYCPICGEEFTENTEIFIGPDGIVGCENCITSSYPTVIEEDLLDLDRQREIRWVNEKFDISHEWGREFWQR